MVFGQDEKNLDAWNSGLLQLTIKKREGEEEEEEEKEDGSDDDDSWDWSDSSDDDLEDDFAEIAEMMSMFGMKDKAKEIIDTLDDMKELKKSPSSKYWKRLYRAPPSDLPVLPEGALDVGVDGDHGVCIASVVVKENKDTRMIGKLHRGNVYVAHNGKEIDVRDVDEWKVFCVSRDGPYSQYERTKWISKKLFEEKKASKDYLPSIEVEGCVVGRMKTPRGDGTTYIPGWVKDGVIHAPYDRQEFTSKNYEVLCVYTKSIQRTS